MGQFTEGDVTVVALTEESANKIADQIQNLDEYIKSKTDEPFGTSVHDIDVDDTCVYVRLNSGRYPNAEWQCNQILEMKKTYSKERLNMFRLN